MGLLFCCLTNVEKCKNDALSQEEKVIKTGYVNLS